MDRLGVLEDDYTRELRDIASIIDEATRTLDEQVARLRHALDATNPEDTGPVWT